jgi:alkanesulfonate monooxygenase SsuD/methylene tetrahydromethanopterin reductase-like flavin-dependent oxidoreductase (luciferase family)
MQGDLMTQVGAMFRCAYPPELLPGFARTVEQLGYDELWVVEDCFFPAGIATATAALSVTERITVGIGGLPAVLRNPALAAMELAGLARMFPGRVLPGFVHGIADWMRQAGAFPGSQLAALGETVTAVRSLLAGEQVTMSGRHVQLADVRLVFPPEVVPPLSTGVRGPKSLRMSGEVADGTILAEMASPGYVSWAREQIAAQRPHRLTVYAFLEIGDDKRSELREALAEALRANGPAIGVDGDLAAEVAALAQSAEDDKALAAALPDAYVDELGVSGTPDECAARIEALRQAGADSVIFVPSIDPDVAGRQLETAARQVLPLLTR